MDIVFNKGACASGGFVAPCNPQSPPALSDLQCTPAAQFGTRFSSNSAPILGRNWYPFFSKNGTRFSPILVPVFRQFWYPFFQKIGTHFRHYVGCSLNTSDTHGRPTKMGTNFGEKRVPKFAKNGYQIWRKTGTKFPEKRVPNLGW